MRLGRRDIGDGVPYVTRYLGAAALAYSQRPGGLGTKRKGHIHNIIDLINGCETSVPE